MYVCVSGRARLTVQISSSTRIPFHHTSASRTATAASPPTLPILLCGDLNARPPTPLGPKAAEEEDYPPEAVPIVLAATEGTGEDRGLGFESCYDLSECVCVL